MTDTLRLAVSNIAWNADEDDAIGLLLQSEGVAGVEIAPTKWRERPLDATAREIADYRRAWEERGLRIVSMQSLLFGRPDLQLFGDTRTSAQPTFSYGRSSFGANLGAHALVFGSPRNRVRGDAFAGRRDVDCRRLLSPARRARRGARRDAVHRGEPARVRL